MTDEEHGEGAKGEGAKDETLGSGQVDVDDSGSLELRATTGFFISGSTFSGTISGDQTVTFHDAEVQIRIATAEHQRELERERQKRALEKEEREEAEAAKDRHWQRVRESCTYGIVAFLVAGLLVGSFLVAVFSWDEVQQTWAQGLATTIAGALAGGFAGYMIGGRK